MSRSINVKRGKKKKMSGVLEKGLKQRYLVDQQVEARRIIDIMHYPQGHSIFLFIYFYFIFFYFFF